MDLENRLEFLGYTVVGIAGSGPEAIDKSVEWTPDIVLMDINLNSDLDGIEAAVKIREILDVPVIFMTAYSDDATLVRAKLAGSVWLHHKAF